MFVKITGNLDLVFDRAKLAVKVKKFSDDHLNKVRKDAGRLICNSDK